MITRKFGVHSMATNVGIPSMAAPIGTPVTPEMVRNAFERLDNQNEVKLPSGDVSKCVGDSVSYTDWVKMFGAR